MDYNFYIILSEKDLEQVGISELKAGWGEEDVAFEPRRFMFEDKVLMYSTEHRIHSTVDEQEVTMRIVEGLNNLEWDINQKSEKLLSNPIIRMLQKISQLSKYSMCIFEDDKVIDQRIECADETNLIQLVIYALNWEAPQNIEILKSGAKEM